MRIEESDFILVPSKNDGSSLWDLSLLYKVNSKTGESRNEFKVVGYGMTMEHALKRVINYRVMCKAKDSAIKLRDYLKIYNKLLNELKKSISSEEILQ